MRISDWSSDVCSSDLDTKHQHNDGNAGKEIVPLRHGLRLVRETDETLTRPKCDQAPGQCNDNSRATGSVVSAQPCAALIRSPIARPRSDERRVGEECVMRVRTRWTPHNKKKK